MEASRKRSRPWTRKVRWRAAPQVVVGGQHWVGKARAVTQEQDPEDAVEAVEGEPQCDGSMLRHTHRVAQRDFHIRKEDW